MFLDWLTTRAEKVDPIHPRDPGLASLFGLGTDTPSGMRVNEDTAANLAAVYSAVMCISETWAGLPTWVYRMNGDDRDRQRQHPAQRVIKTPNRNMTAVVARETLMANKLLWGNCYAEIVRNREGTPRGS